MKSAYNFLSASLLALLTGVFPLAAAVVDPNPPVIVSTLPPPGTLSNLTSITVTFSEPVTGVRAELLLLNGRAAGSVTGTNRTYTFGFLQPSYGLVAVTWEASQEIIDSASPPNRFNPSGPGATWQYTLVDLTAPKLTSMTPPDRAQVRRLGEIEVVFIEPVDGVDALDLLINGQPATNVLALPVNRYRFQFPEPAPGTVRFSWASGHGITDLADSPNSFVGGTWTCQLDPNASSADLVVTEILAGNQQGLTDEDGEAQDWIEIFNRGSNPVDLSGWSLSDDPEEPGQWVFPARVLGAGQYLVVFASGKNRVQPAGTNLMHTNFKLSRAGKFLGLYTPDSPRMWASGFDPQYPEQRNDYSYGPDSAGAWRYFSPPSPGRPNGVSTIQDMAAPVHFSAPRGYYNQPFDVHLSTDTPGAMIRFTTDGSEPGAGAGQLYLGPVRITSTTMLRAAAFKTNFLSSRVGTHSYFYNQSAAIRSLPVISIVTASNNMIGPTGILGISTDPTNSYHNPSQHGLAWERPTSVEFIRPEDNSGFQMDCGIRVQGSDYQRPRTTPSSKFSFRLYFRGTYGFDRLEYPLFPLSTAREFNQIVLRAGYNDPDNPFIRDELARRLSHDQGQTAAHGTLVNLFVNGIYKGYYNPTERVNEDFGQTYHGGSDEWDVVSPSFAQSSGAPGVVDGDRASFQALVSFINRSAPATPAQYQQIEQKLDLVNFTDYLLLNIYAGMGDWPGNNFRAGKDRAPGGIFRFYVWDGEWGFGIYGRAVNRDTFAESGAGPDDSGLASTGYSEIAQMYQKLRGSPEFRLLFADRIQKHFFNGGALMDTNITARFSQMRANMMGVLPGMDTSILAGWVPQRRGVIMNLFNTYGYGVYTNAPVFGQFGGRVPRGFNLAMSNLVGTIYYTTDGSDPRVRFTGAVAPGARAYQGPVSLNQSCTVRTRSLQGTNWSALTEAAFQVAWLGLPLRITELNYNPPGGSACEFLELYNFDGSALDLSGMYFEKLGYTFPQGAQLAPGAALVLVSNYNTNAFRARYPGVIIDGVFSGQLDNGGERIILRDRQGQMVCGVNYDDANGWPKAADGGGATLEIVDPMGDPDDPANWRASSMVYGTPGTLSPPPPPGAVVINEIMAVNQTAVANGSTYPDWIELHNTSAEAVDVSGWSLSNDGNARKFVFPDGARLEPHSHWVVWCDDATNTTPGWHSGFALQSAGDRLFLFNASTSLVDAVSFGMQVPDYSIGRIDGLWQLTDPTPGAINAAAATGSATNLALNEWLTNPPSGQPDWIELFNRSAQPVSLQGCYVAGNNGLHRLSTLAFVPARSFLQLWADEGVGPDHLNFKLPAPGGWIALYDSLGLEITRVNYGAQTEGVSQGRLPDGNANVVSFAGSTSPGAANYTINYTGPYLNEVLARNRAAVTNSAGQTADFIELYNPSASGFDLGGMSLSVDQSDAPPWLFPAGVTIPGRGYLVVWGDGSRPASTSAEALLNCGRSLGGESGGVYLFSAAGQRVDAVEYGFQVTDLPIGRAGAPWRLLSAATPGAANAPAAALGLPAALRINEWMARPAAGPDWFELFNTTNRPVEMSKLYLSDDVSLAGAAAFQIAPLSFIGGGQWARWIADADPAQGRDHVNFALDAAGESLRLCATNLTVIDAVFFGPQILNVSAGRLPDGRTNVVAFPGSATPGESNYRPLENAVISEILPAVAAPFEAAVEIHNPSAESADVGGWYLSDTQDNFRKYRIPEGTRILAGGFVVFYENSFHTGASNGFTFQPALGGEVWLSSADAAGNLTGYRAGAKFGPAWEGVSSGRFSTSGGVEYVPLSRPTFGMDQPASLPEFRTGAGAANAVPQVGPVVINEIMYHPPTTANPAEDVEYLELYNLEAEDMPLFDLNYPANRWRLANAVEYIFPPGTILPARSYVLVVDFDPAVNPAALEAFRNRYGLTANVPIYGPFQGKLDNAGESLELYQPGITSAANGYPLLRVDRVYYTGDAPWPSGAVNGGGLSLQRRGPECFGNEATNWFAAAPTPGSTNLTAAAPAPVITQSPTDQVALADGPLQLQVLAQGAVPLVYQWRWNGLNLPGATNATLAFEDAQPEDSGIYDVVVSNPGGAAVSAPARLDILRLPQLVSAPTNQTLSVGAKTSLSVVVWGSGPFSYQWWHNGQLLPNETAPTLTLSRVQIADEGEYEVRVRNAAGEVAARATLAVLMTPTFLQMPLSHAVVAGGDVSVSVLIEGNPAPFTYTWKRITSPTTTLATMVSDAKSNFFTFNTTEAGFVLVGEMLSTNFSCRVFVNSPATSPSGVSRPFNITVLADLDQNGLPEVWESAYEPVPGAGMDPALDSDGDGLSNLEEYQAGTDPTNPLHRLQIDLTNSAGQAVVSFAAVSNKTYTVEYRDGLNTETPWNKLADLLARSSNRVETVTDPAWTTNRFYRVATPWRP